MMTARESEKIVVRTLKNKKKVFIQFIHMEHMAVRAEITASDTPGQLNYIRNTPEHWVLLNDTLDRKILGALTSESQQIDLETEYFKYTVNELVT